MQRRTRPQPPHTPRPLQPSASTERSGRQPAASAPPESRPPGQRTGTPPIRQTSQSVPLPAYPLPATITMEASQRRPAPYRGSTSPTDHAISEIHKNPTNGGARTPVGTRCNAAPSSARTIAQTRTPGAIETARCPAATRARGARVSRDQSGRAPHAPGTPSRPRTSGTRARARSTRRRTSAGRWRPTRRRRRRGWRKRLDRETAEVSTPAHARL